MCAFDLCSIYFQGLNLKEDKHTIQMYIVHWT